MCRRRLNIKRMLNRKNLNNLRLEKYLLRSRQRCKCLFKLSGKLLLREKLLYKHPFRYTFEFLRFITFPLKSSEIFPKSRRFQLSY